MQPASLHSHFQTWIWQNSLTDIRKVVAEIKKRVHFQKGFKCEICFCNHWQERISSILNLSYSFLAGAYRPTCIRFMASRIWSRWCAELRASSRISVNFNSFSLSSLFNCRIISASASVHSQILKKETSTKSAVGEARGLGKAMVLLKAEMQYYPAGTEIICCWQNLEKRKKSFTNSSTFIGSKLKRVGLCLSLFF